MAQRCAGRVQGQELAAFPGLRLAYRAERRLQRTGDLVGGSERARHQTLERLPQRCVFGRADVFMRQHHAHSAGLPEGGGGDHNPACLGVFATFYFIAELGALARHDLRDTGSDDTAVYARLAAAPRIAREIAVAGAQPDVVVALRLPGAIDRDNRAVAIEHTNRQGQGVEQQWVVQRRTRRELLKLFALGNVAGDTAIAEEALTGIEGRLAADADEARRAIVVDIAQLEIAKYCTPFQLGRMGLPVGCAQIVEAEIA